MILRKETIVPGMDEPARKKLKLQDDTIDEDLENVQQNLLGQCLCSVSESCLRKPFQGIKIMTEDDLNGWRSAVVAGWSRGSTLLFVSTIQLLCEVAIKQNTRGLVCSRISDAIDALIRNEHELVDHLIELGAHPDRFVCFAAGRALSAFFIVSRAHVDPRWVDRLTENAVNSTHPHQMAFSLDVVKHIIEWKDCVQHPLQEETDEDQTPSLCHVLRVNDPQLEEEPDKDQTPSLCHVLRVDPETLSINDPESLDSSHIKCLCIKALAAKWPSIVSRFGALMTPSFSQSYEATVITFLGLWEAIISVKANLSIVDTKPFYAHLDGFVSLLNSGIPPILWKHLLNLFNEVLCYGSTLALQDVLAEEPCSLAHLVVRSVKDWRLLDSLPYRGGSGRFGGGSGDGDRPLLQKAVLLVLKAVAVTVKETRCDSSSDSSLSSEAEDADADMAVIERSIREVLRQLDLCVKALLPFHPETPLAQWVVQLFADQDDSLVEGMVCCLDVTVGLLYRESALPDLRLMLSPVVSFVQFVRAVSCDSSVLLDLLVSNETCFLLYLLRLLKYIRRNWPEFISVCDREVDDIMSVLIRLRLAIDRLVSKNLFPYNIDPVLRLLEKCEQMYEGNHND